jgi:hypothetical protein
VLSYGSENWTITARDTRRITAAEIKVYKTNCRMQLDRLYDKHRYCKGTKYNRSFGQNIGIQKALVAKCKQCFIMD